MGENVYETAHHLFLVRTGQVERDAENFAMAHGHRTEDQARRALAARLDLDLQPKCYESGEEPLLRASLDGADLDLTYIAEIKCPITLTSFILAKEGTVPEHYWGQIQHQLYVCGNPDVCYFWVWYDGEGALVEVHPDLDYQNRAVAAALEFWDRVQRKEWPGPDSKLILDFSEDTEWVGLAARFKIAFLEEVRAKAAVEKLKSALIGKVGRAAFSFGAGVEVTQKKRRGAVNYSQVPVVSQMDDEALDRFRKPTVYYHEVTQKGSTKPPKA